jgi:hypothetical protein
MFDPIPAWLTEIPLQSMESHQDMSNVEVYVRGDTGDVLKAVCDNSGNAVNNEMGIIKGTETSCAFRYEANITAIISNFTMQEIDGPNKFLSRRHSRQSKLQCYHFHERVYQLHCG